LAFFLPNSDSINGEHEFDKSINLAKIPIFLRTVFNTGSNLDNISVDRFFPFLTTKAWPFIFPSALLKKLDYSPLRAKWLLPRGNSSRSLGSFPHPFLKYFNLILNNLHKLRKILIQYGKEINYKVEL